jgi:hypothetical protein
MRQPRNRNQKLTLVRGVELRRRGHAEDPRELAREFDVSLAYAYKVIRGECHHPRVLVELDDVTLLRLDALARQRRVPVEALCAEMLSDAAASP